VKRMPPLITHLGVVDPAQSSVAFGSRVNAIAALFGSPRIAGHSRRRASGLGPASFLVVLRLRRRGRVELDQALRFLVGQPQDQVIAVGIAGQRALLVGGQRLHLRHGRDRSLAGLVGLAQSEQLIAR